MPEELGYIWAWFLELRTAEPLAYSEIASWAALTRTNVLPWEVRLLRSLDRLFQRVLHE